MNTLLTWILIVLIYLVVSYPLRKLFLYWLEKKQPNRFETVYDKPAAHFFSIAVLSFLLMIVFCIALYFLCVYFVIPIFFDSGIISNIIGRIFS